MLTPTKKITRIFLLKICMPFYSGYFLTQNIMQEFFFLHFIVINICLYSISRICSMVKRLSGYKCLGCGNDLVFNKPSVRALQLPKQLFVFLLRRYKFAGTGRRVMEESIALIILDNIICVENVLNSDFKSAI